MLGCHALQRQMLKGQDKNNNNNIKNENNEETKSSGSVSVDEGLVPRPRLECQELCRIECSKKWSYIKACYDIHWGCLTGCATSCTKGNMPHECRSKCEDKFDHRCDALGCIQPYV